VLTHVSQGHEIKEGGGITDRLELVQTTVPGDLDSPGFFSLQWRNGSEGHDLPAHELVAIPKGLDFWRLRHEVDGAVCTLQHKKGPAPDFVLRSADHASADFHTRRELGEEPSGVRVDEELAIARETPLERAGKLHLLKYGPMMFGKLEGALSDPPREPDLGEES
jgi:hypothetical protein